jgi:ParB family chromosome partitioning protein
MPSNVLDINPKEINIGSRFRDDLGSLDDLKASIKEKGIIQPITCTPDLRLLTGHRRLTSAIELGLDTVPVILREVSGEIDFREIELIENICRKDLHWSERAKLEQHIHELKSKEKGWSQAQTAALLGQSQPGLNRHLQLAKAMEAIPDLKDAKTEDAAWKALQRVKEQAVVRELNERQHKGSSSLAKVVSANYLLGDAVAEMSKMDQVEVFTFAEVDPPYGINLDTMKMFKEEMSEYREVSKKDYERFTIDAATQVYRLLRPDSWCIWWFGPTNWETVRRSLLKSGFSVDEIPGIWNKDINGQTMQPDYHLGNSWEPFFICYKGRPVLSKPGRSNVFRATPVYHADKSHPTERPEALMQELFSTFCQPGARILSPFLGSGVAIRAAHKAGMNCIGWDISEEYRQLAIVKAES